jgi:hypothetical protein
MTITVRQLSFTGGEWSEALHSRTDLSKYTTAVRRMKNFVVHPHGGASNRGGMEFIAEVKDSSKFTRLIPFQFSVEQAYILEFGDQYFRIYKDGGRVESGGSSVEVATTYLEADLPLLKFTQSADVLFIAHPSYPARKVSRTSDTAWSINTITFGASVTAPTGVTSSGYVSDSDSYLVTAIDSSGRESVGSSSVQVSDGAVLSWTAVSGADYYNVYKDNTSSGVYGYAGRASGTSFTVPSAGIEADFTQSPPEDVALFDGTDKYPGVCTFFEQRLCFARTNNQPQTIWGSVTGDFENMNSSAFVNADDAYEFTINARQVNEIRALIPLEALIILTSGAEWVMRAGGGSDAVTPASVDLKAQSQFGCSDVQPVVIGNSVLFVEYSGSVVRDLTYSYEIDGYKGNSLSVFANHLLEGYHITEWAYQRDPDSVVWAIRNDGTLLALTYYKEHNVFGWSRHDTQGTFESTATIPNDSGLDEVYFIVKRTVDGNTVRYIERFRARLPLDDNYTRDVKNAFFVDSGLSYDGTASSNISGLDHLEGESVVALADGSVVKNLTVSSGSVTLPNAAEKVHVGLSYESEIETLDFIAQSAEGTTQDKLKDVKSVVVSLKDSRALYFGPNEDRLVEVAFREDEAYGTPTDLFSGDKEIFLEAGDARNSKALIKITEPLPLTVLALLPRLEYGDS